MVIAMMGADLSTGAGVSYMIGFSVRWAVPFIFLVVAAPAVQTLVSWAISDVVATQSKIPWDVFCCCHGMARCIHLHDVELFP